MLHSDSIIGFTLLNSPLITNDRVSGIGTGATDHGQLKTKKTYFDFSIDQHVLGQLYTF